MYTSEWDALIILGAKSLLGRTPPINYDRLGLTTKLDTNRSDSDH